jgi:hypothetical protein
MCNYVQSSSLEYFQLVSFDTHKLAGALMAIFGHFDTVEAYDRDDNCIVAIVGDDKLIVSEYEFLPSLDYSERKDRREINYLCRLYWQTAEIIEEYFSLRLCEGQKALAEIHSWLGRVMGSRDKASALLSQHRWVNILCSPNYTVNIVESSAQIWADDSIYAFHTDKMSCVREYDHSNIYKSDLMGRLVAELPDVPFKWTPIKGGSYHERWLYGAIEMNLEDLIRVLPILERFANEDANC